MKHFKRLFSLVLFSMVAFFATVSVTYASPEPAFTLRVNEDGYWNEFNITTSDDLVISIDPAFGNLDVVLNGTSLNLRSEHIQISNVQFAFTMTDGSTYTEYVPISQFMDINIEPDGGDVWIYDNSGTLGGGWVGSLDFIFDLQPVLTGETAFVTNVDAPLSEATIRSYISAYDETDGNITHLITKTSDTYTPNMNTVGTYQIVYSVQDSSGNTTTLTVSVLVRDVTAPTWNIAKDNVQVSYTQTFDIEAYKTQLGASDNYDPSGSLVISVQSNNYTANKTVVGTYYVVYKIKDTAGNETLAEVEVQVIDTVAPVFSGPSTIVKPNTSVLTLNDIKGQLSANDAVSGNLTSSIVVTEDNYTGKAHLVGSYTIKFAVTDPAGNTATHTVTVSVEDNIPPIFYVKDNYFITVDQSVALTLAQIIEILEITGQLDTSGSGGVQVTTLVNEYIGNENVPGIYAVSLKAVSVSGNESIYNVAIEVMETSTEDPIIIDEEPPFYQPIVDVAIIAWAWISSNILLSIGLGVLLVGIIMIMVFVSSGNKRKPYHYRKH